MASSELLFLFFLSGKQENHLARNFDVSWLLSVLKQFNRMHHFSWEWKKKKKRQSLTYCYENFRWTWKKTRLVTGLSVSLTSVLESELVLWHKNSVYTSALLYMDSDRSEKLKCVDTEHLLIKSSVCKTRINPAGWKSPLWGSQEQNPSLSRLWRPCVVPLVMTGGWTLNAQLGPCWTLPTQDLRSQSPSQGCCTWCPKFSLSFLTGAALHPHQS